MRPLALTLCLLGLAACDAADPMPPADGAQRFRVEVTNVAPAFAVLKSGDFAVPVGASAPGPIGPGGAYEFSFTAARAVTPGSGMRLSLATMFVQSNDLFYAFPPEGLALFAPDGTPRTGDVTSELRLYDAGTEVNETPGVGPHQAPRQAGANSGTPENGIVREIPEGQPDVAGFTYPATASVLRVTLTHDGGTRFTVRITNASTPSTLALPGGGSVAVPLAPGAWAVHTDAARFYTLGAPAVAGLEGVAEDGETAAWVAALAPVTGVTDVISPGTAAVHTSAARLFAAGAAASAGLEDIAEDGMPDALTAALTGVAGVRRAQTFAVPVGGSAPGPAGPGAGYAFEVEAAPGERLSFATMYVQSNDYVLAPEPAGIALFTPEGVPVSGDVSAQVRLWDAGTEVDEEPGVGRHQAIRQSGPDDGPAENGVVTRVDGLRNGYTYPAASSVVRVTITPLGGA